jgi:drug/metabolite transporter (DMT)-like permease
LLQKLQPIFAIILAHFVLKETIRKNFVFWAFLAMIGAGLVGHREFLSAIDYIMNSSNGGNSVGAKGIILTLIAAGGWGASTVFGKVLSNKGVTEWGIIAGRYLFGGLILAPIMFSPTNNVSNVELEVWGKILVMAILSGIIAMYLYYTGLKKLSARVATLAELFFPFSAVVVNWIFLGATLNLIQVLGGLLLIISSGVIQWKKY